MYSIYYNYY